MKFASPVIGSRSALLRGCALALCFGACAGPYDEPEDAASAVLLELKKGCGDEVCGANEHCRNCSVDCGPCSPSCGDGFCSSTEGCAGCPADCGVCPPACGDGACNGTETCASCSSDCGACPPACGDGACNACESCDSCAADCGACGGPCALDDECVPAQPCHATSCALKSEVSGSCHPLCDLTCQPLTLDCGQGSCACEGGRCIAVLKPVCGDGTCQAEESCTTCAGDCGACPAACGDGSCSGGETCATCAADCGACLPSCTIDADCVPATCCHPGSCVPLAQAPVCNGIACTADCQPYTMDCGQGYCACQAGQCAVVLVETTF